MPSSIPTTKTTGNSRPFALWMLISVTVLSSSACLSISVLSTTLSKKRAKVGSDSPVSSTSSRLSASNSFATEMNSIRFSIRDCASIVFSLRYSATRPDSSRIYSTNSEIPISSFLIMVSRNQEANAVILEAARDNAGYASAVSKILKIG